MIETFIGKPKTQKGQVIYKAGSRRLEIGPNFVSHELYQPKRPTTLKVKKPRVLPPSEVNSLNFDRVNSRRIQLIYQESLLGLTLPEVFELEKLQALVDQYLCSMDPGLVSWELPRLDQQG